MTDNAPGRHYGQTEGPHTPASGTNGLRLSRRNILRSGISLAGGAAATGLLAACGGGNAAAKSANKLTIWHFMTGTSLTLLNGWIHQFNQQYPHVIVDAVPIPATSIAQKVIAAAASRSGPDVIIFTDGNAYQANAAGALADMSHYWSTLPQSDQKDFPSFAFLRASKGFIGIKTYYNCVALWYNKDILAKAHSSPPTSVSSFHNSMGAVKAFNKQYLPFSLTGDNQLESEWQSFPWLTGFGWSYADPRLEPLVSTFSLLKSWVDAGYVTKDESTYTQGSCFDRFMAGDVAFCEDGNWELGTASAGAKFSYGVMALPTRGSIYVGGDAYCIGAFSGNPEVAWEFLRSSVLTSQGELAALRLTGNIPMRTSLANSAALRKVNGLPVFVQEISKHGAQHPPIIRGHDITNAQLAIAQGWNGVMGGVISPQAAAASALSGVKAALKAV